VVTRLRQGATWQEADAQINRAWSQRASRYESDGNPGAAVRYYSVPLQKGQTASLRPPVLALMIAAGFILLIACANLAGLTLVRMLRRTGEVATRMALGASSWQIQRQFWIENLLVALLGGGFAVGVAVVALRLLLSLLPEHFLPVASVSLDARVLGFTLALSVMTSLLFGMLPAFAARKVDFRASMTERTVAAIGSPRLRQGLIAGEVALTVVLLAGAGLLVRSLIHLETLPPGFNSEGLLVAKASLDDARYHDPATFRKLLDQSLAAMRAIPGVEGAAVGSNLPYEFTGNDRVTLSDGKEAGYQSGADWVYVTPGYFETLEMPLLAGRAFTEADGPDAQPVAIVNHAFAHKFYGGGNPVGRYINGETRIVGEVSDVPLSSGLDAMAPLQTEETLYVPAAQLDQRSSKNHPILSIVHVWVQPNWVVRTAGPVMGLTGRMQRALAGTDAGLPFSGFYSMKDLLARTLATQRIEVALLGALAALALLLSAVGIFGLVANIVSQRTREIGIRMALGSSVRKAMCQVGLAGAAASALGAVVGLALSAGTLPAMRNAIFGVGVYDASTLLTVVSALALVVSAATIVPALRIAKIDPAKVLRDE
jgi:predicted permease